jgi:YesN/AraC family two-component response regulator
MDSEKSDLQSRGIRTSTMKRPLLLLVDLRLSSEEAAPMDELGRLFEVQTARKTERLHLSLEREMFDVVCFDFDYPDRSGLQRTRDIKAAFPAIPMIMTTVQHSEALAVWAFRSRLADFLVKPIPYADLQRCHEMIVAMGQAKRLQGARDMPELVSPTPQVSASVPSAKQRSLEPAVNYVAQHFREKMPNQTVAALCNMSPFAFSRAFKKEYGIQFRDYVVRYRLREACRLLDNPNVSISDVAYAVGFNDVSYFSRMFKRYFGVSASTRIKEVAAGEVDQSATVELKIPSELLGDRVH